MITWQAGTSAGPDIHYRFRVLTTRHPVDSLRRKGRRYIEYQTIRDYSRLSSLDWTATESEGTYVIEVSAKDIRTGEVTTAAQVYQFLSRVSSGQPVVSPTTHPLVFLFSAPPCLPGGRMRVQFQSGSGPVQQTPFKTCDPGSSMNFYLAGLRAESTYSAYSSTESANQVVPGSAVSFRTGPLPSMPWTQTAVIPAPPGATQPVLLGTSGGTQVATDLDGDVIWYNPSPFTWATRPEAGGYLWGVMEDLQRDITFQSIRAVDLVGMTVLEMNAERVNEQLVQLGRRPISGFHHEVRPLPNGRILALAGVEQMLTDVQGAGTKDVIGDMIIVFDRDLNVLWSWDSFDHLDVTRLSTSEDICTKSNNGCPSFYLADQANDWTHGNAVQLTPDGHLLYSARHQDWLIKINYANGEGGGDVLWRLGRDGDFTYPSDDPYPWFSHQHDGNFVTSDPSRLAVFDNGNTRKAALGGVVNSRGQVIELDAAGRIANLLLDIDLGVLSLAVGSAQLLDNGNYHFNAGFVLEQGQLHAYAFEVAPSGQIVAKLRASTGLYRSFRMRDMYSGE